MTISPPAVLHGVQEPRVLTTPLAAGSAGPEAVELAASAGLELDPWQRFALEHACAERADGRWAAFEVGVVVPRQNGKGAILEARELAGLFLWGEELLLHSAHEFKTAQEAFLRVLALIESTPDLERLVARVRRAHGDEGIELKSGARLRFVARSGGSGRGFTGDCVVLDEAYNLPAKAIAALLPTMSARPNPQLWYTSSAPLNDPVSDLLRRLRKRGKTGSDRLCFMEWSAPDDADLDSEEALAQANPGLGFRIEREFCRAEREAMPDDDYARERLGISPDPGEESSVIPMDDWHRCEDAASGFTGRPVLAIDVAPDRGSASIAAAGLRSDGLPHAEVIDMRAGTGWVVDRLLELKKHAPLRRVGDAKAVGSLLADANARGVPIEPLTMVQHAQACDLILERTKEHTIRHRPDPRLDVALRGSAKRNSGDGWLWSRRTSSVDITCLVAFTLGLWAACQPTAQAGFKDLDDYYDDE